MTLLVNLQDRVSQDREAAGQADLALHPQQDRPPDSGPAEQEA